MNSIKCKHQKETGKLSGNEEGMSAANVRFFYTTSTKIKLSTPPLTFLELNPVWLL